MKFPIYLLPGKISSNSQKAITLQKTKNIGELKNNQIIYSTFEALYLIETKKAELFKNNKKVSREKSIKEFIRKDKEFYIKYLVFKYLRKKGYIVKTALKFGEEFRIYEKNKHNSHAKWIVFPIKYTNKIILKELISKSRIAHSTAKKLLLAIVDSQEDIVFYEIEWLKI